MGLVDKFLCCFELKWAVIIIGFVDMILSILCGCYLPWIRRKGDLDYFLATSYTEASSTKWIGPAEYYHSRFGYSMYVFLLVVLILHVCACILLIISAFSAEKLMVAPYIATALMRFVLLFLILAWLVAKSHDSKTSYWLLGLSLFPATYFWLTAVSWYAENDSE